MVMMVGALTELWDSDCTGNPCTHHSTTRVALNFCSGPILCGRICQPIVDLPSVVAGNHATCYTPREAIWLHLRKELMCLQPGPLFTIAKTKVAFLLTESSFSCQPSLLKYNTLIFGDLWSLETSHIFPLLIIPEINSICLEVNFMYWEIHLELFLLNTVFTAAENVGSLIVTSARQTLNYRSSANFFYNVPLTFLHIFTCLCAKSAKSF